MKSLEAYILAFNFFFGQSIARVFTGNARISSAHRDSTVRARYNIIIFRVHQCCRTSLGNNNYQTNATIRLHFISICVSYVLRGATVYYYRYCCTALARPVRASADDYSQSTLPTDKSFRIVILPCYGQQRRDTRVLQ